MPTRQATRIKGPPSLRANHHGRTERTLHEKRAERISYPFIQEMLGPACENVSKSRPRHVNLLSPVYGCLYPGVSGEAGS